MIRHGDTTKTAAGGNVEGTAREEERSLGTVGTAWGGCNQTFAAGRGTVRLGARHAGPSPAVVAAGKFAVRMSRGIGAERHSKAVIIYAAWRSYTGARPISAPSFFISLAVFSGFFYVVCAFCIAAL